jgi:hypothetical protein
LRGCSFYIRAEARIKWLFMDIKKDKEWIVVFRLAIRGL